MPDNAKKQRVLHCDRSATSDNRAVLCQRAASGDRDAEARLMKALMPTVYRQVNRLLWDKSWTGDLVQETMVVATQKLRAGAIAQPESVMAYVHSIARHVVINHLRRAQREYEYITFSGTEEVPTNPSDNGADPFVVAEAEQIRQRLRGRIARLTKARDRRILIGTYFDQIAAPALCRELDLSPEHYSRVLYRARKRLERLCDGSLA